MKRKFTPTNLVISFFLSLVFTGEIWAQSNPKSNQQVMGGVQTPAVPPADPSDPGLQRDCHTCTPGVNYTPFEGWSTQPDLTQGKFANVFICQPSINLGLGTDQPQARLEIVVAEKNFKAVNGLLISSGALNSQCEKIALELLPDNQSFVGSITNQDFHIRANNLELISLSSTGKLGFRTKNFMADNNLHGSTILGDMNSPLTNSVGDKNVLVTDRLSINTDNVGNTLNVGHGASIGVNAIAPTDGLLVGGQVGIGTATPNAKLEVNGSFAASSAKISSLSPGLIKAGADGTLANATASEIQTTLDISGDIDYIPVFKANNGLQNSRIRQGLTPWSYQAIGFGTSTTQSLLGQFQFGDYQTLHVDAGTSQFAYNTYSSFAGGTWSYPKINQSLGASKMVQGADGSITFRTLQPNETSTQWEAALTMRGDRKVGIGTEQPEEKLHVVGNIFAENVRLSGNATHPLTTGWVFRDDNQWLTTKTNTQVLTDLGLSTLTNGTPFKMAKYNASGALGDAVMREDANGNVSFGIIPTSGIATGDLNQDPSRKGASLFFEGGLPGGLANDGSYGPNNFDPLFIQRFNHSFDRTSLRINIGDDGGQDKAEFGYYKWDNSGWVPSVAIYANGELWAKKVKVTLDAFPDYVFKPDYKLRSLKETEEFIAQNGHLPEVPCAEEVAENGADLGELNKILLKKIEEMTLHLIRMEKEIEELKSKK